MTEKVVITQKQADAIEKYKESETGTLDLLEDITEFEFLHEIKDRDLSVYQKEMEKVLVAFLGGSYEVKPEFKEGDWVVSNKSGKIAKITHVPIAREKVWVDDIEINYFTDYRHATSSEIAEEKERRWWAKHGRDVWELKVGDLLKGLDSGIFYQIDKIDGEMCVVARTNYEELLRDKELLRQIYEVVCFAEDRKDVKSNE